MIALFASLLAGQALAQMPPPVVVVDEDEEEENSVTVSLSALDLFMPMAEVMGEFRLAERSSVAVIGGLGNRDGTTIYDVGAQYREYVIGDFDTGINLGAQAKYTSGDFLEPGAWDDEAVSTLNLGPFLGGKLTVAMFAFDVQAGGQLVWEPGAQDLAIGPLLNVNAGLTF